MGTNYTAAINQWDDNKPARPIVVNISRLRTPNERLNEPIAPYGRLKTAKGDRDG
jgi:hypothetical protein